MVKFLRNLAAVLIGLFIFSFIMFIIIIGFISATLSSSSTEKMPEINPNSVLRLKLEKPILEREREDPFEGIPMFSGLSEGGIGLVELKEAIIHAKTDPNIKGIFLEASSLASGVATTGEIRKALEDFKASGKFIISYSEYFTEGAYYLSTVADEVYMNPDFSYMEFNGLLMERFYFKGLLDMLEIEALPFKAGDYKEISEPFERKDMSEPVRKRNTELTNKIYNKLLSDISDSRDISFETLKNISDSSLVGLGKQALTYRMIDGVKYYDEVLDIVREKLKINEGASVNFVSYNKYRKSYKTHKSSSNKIAVIVASGEIHDGKGDNETIGSESFAKELRKAADNDRIKAIVLRINSPGGSALASDVMWREVRNASAKKPIIASMSDVAASGGYYMAMGCDTIVAEENTITGSIGVFSMVFNTKGFLNEKLGITTDKVKTGKYSDIYSMTKSLDKYEKAFLQNITEEAYNSFITKAASGRNMEVSELEQLASGRIWTGTEAVENGLVDMIGNLDDAIDIAAQKAGISDDYALRYYPEQKSALEELISGLTEEQEERMLKSNLGELYPYYKKLESVKSMTGPQARTFSEISF